VLEGLNLETIDRIISQCEEIFKMLSIEGYEHIESIVRRTKILSDICNNEVISLWLWFELNGWEDSYSIRCLNHPDDIKLSAYAIWERIHKVQDSKEQLKLLDEIQENEFRNRDEFDRKRLSLEYKTLSPLSILELVKSIESSPTLNESANTTNVLRQYKIDLVCYGNCRLVLKRLKNEIINYVSKVYKEAIKIKDEINDRNLALETEIERYKKRTLKHRTKKIWGWIKEHKLISAITTLIMLIASILTILLFFGYSFKDIIRWFDF